MEECKSRRNGWNTDKKWEGEGKGKEREEKKKKKKKSKAPLLLSALPAKVLWEKQGKEKKGRGAQSRAVESCNRRTIRREAWVRIQGPLARSKG